MRSLPKITQRGRISSDTGLPQGPKLLSNLVCPAGLPPGNQCPLHLTQTRLCICKTQGLGTFVLLWSLIIPDSSELLMLPKRVGTAGPFCKESDEQTRVCSLRNAHTTRLGVSSPDCTDPKSIVSLQLGTVHHRPPMTPAQKGRAPLGDDLLALC